MPLAALVPLGIIVVAFTVTGTGLHYIPFLTRGEVRSPRRTAQTIHPAAQIPQRAAAVVTLAPTRPPPARPPRPLPTSPHRAHLASCASQRNRIQIDAWKEGLFHRDKMIQHHVGKA